MEKFINSTFRTSLGTDNRTTKDKSANEQQRESTLNRVIYEYGDRQIWKDSMMGVATPNLCQLRILQDEPALLLDSSTAVFGNECLRLVNIAFQTSKMFPSIMATCDDISRYLQKELQQRHPKRCFHIIITENSNFGFALDDCIRFATVKQDQYQVLIFSTKSHKSIKMDTHDANNQMKLQWKSVLFTRLNN